MAMKNAHNQQTLPEVAQVTPFPPTPAQWSLTGGGTEKPFWSCGQQVFVWKVMW